MNAYLVRLLTPAEDVRGGPAEGWAVVLGYGFWKNNFGGDPSIVGKQIRLSNAIVTIVGVAPQNFRGVWPGSETKLYLPFQFHAVLNSRDESSPPESLWWCHTVGRLRPGGLFNASLSDAGPRRQQKDFLVTFSMVESLPCRLEYRPWIKVAKKSNSFGAPWTC